MNNSMITGIKERIQSASTVAGVQALLKRSSQFADASPRQHKRWDRIAKSRLKELTRQESTDAK